VLEDTRQHARGRTGSTATDALFETLGKILNT
jgi:hypothetical protein